MWLELFLFLLTLSHIFVMEFGFVIHCSQFNTLQYSDAESVAKIDSELKQAQSELDQLVKEKHESQEQLDKQNSKSTIIKL